MGELKAYPEWDHEINARWIDAANVFGRHLMSAAKDFSFERMSPSLSDSERNAAEKAALDAIHGVMMLLDGIAATRAGPGHVIDYALIARVRDRQSDTCVESIELAPSGDGLCMGLAGWSQGDFGA